MGRAMAVGDRAARRGANTTTTTLAPAVCKTHGAARTASFSVLKNSLGLWVWPCWRAGRRRLLSSSQPAPWCTPSPDSRDATACGIHLHSFGLIRKGLVGHNRVAHAHVLELQAVGSEASHVSAHAGSSACATAADAAWAAAGARRHGWGARSGLCHAQTRQLMRELVETVCES